MGLCKDCGVDAGFRRRYCDRHARYRRLQHWARMDGQRPHHSRDRYRATRQALTDGLVACEICKTAFGTDRATTPCWDHDHTTGQFRGWLCHRCNVALGLMADDPARLRAAADYLDEHRV